MGPDRRKELLEKLAKAKSEKAAAAKLMASAKSSLKKDVTAEQQARKTAQSAMVKATKTDKKKDIKEAKTDERALTADAGRLKKTKAQDKVMKAKLAKVTAAAKKSKGLL